MRIAVYPGSFDPITLGHLDIIKRAAKLVDKLVVAILNNNSKSPLFSVEERVTMLKEVTMSLPNVEIQFFSGLLVDFAKSIDATMIVRGLRAITDFDNELQMAQFNHKFEPDIDTIFLTTNVEYSYLSSSSIKEIAFHKGKFEQFVPTQVVHRLYDKYGIKPRG